MSSNVIEPTPVHSVVRSNSTHSRRRYLALAVVVALVAGSGVVVLVVNPTLFHPQPVGPSSFAPVSGPSQVVAGSAGCHPIASDLCYGVVVTTLFRTLSVSSLTFAASKSSVLQYPMPNNVPLGPDAGVSILNGSKVVAFWNWSALSWSSGSGYVLPYDSDVTMVLDTGLQSNSTLSGNWFSVEHMGPSPAALGFRFT
jgi:hypothetical protein